MYFETLFLLTDEDRSSYSDLDEKSFSSELVDGLNPIDKQEWKESSTIMKLVTLFQVV